MAGLAVSVTTLLNLLRAARSARFSLSSDDTLASNVSILVQDKSELVSNNYCDVSSSVDFLYRAKLSLIAD